MGVDLTNEGDTAREALAVLILQCNKNQVGKCRCTFRQVSDRGNGNLCSTTRYPDGVSCRCWVYVLTWLCRWEEAVKMHRQ